jgi:hypothetical protein
MSEEILTEDIFEGESVDIDFGLEFSVPLINVKYMDKNIKFMASPSYDIDLNAFQDLFTSKIDKQDVYVYDIFDNKPDFGDFLFKLFHSNGVECVNKDNRKIFGLGNDKYYTQELQDKIENLTLHTMDYFPKIYLGKYARFHTYFLRNFKLDGKIGDKMLEYIDEVNDEIYEIGIVNFIKHMHYKNIFVYTTREHIVKIIKYLK